MKTYHEALKTLQSIEEKIATYKKKIEIQKKENHKSYYGKICVLREQISALENEEEQKSKELDNTLEQLIAASGKQPYEDTIKETEELFKIMRRYLSNTSITREPRGKVIVNDKYKQICLYIAPNKKPVNKFSLILRIYSIFHYDYQDFFHWDDQNIIRDGKTEKDLQKWMDKPITVTLSRAKSMPLEQYLEKHKEFEERYEKAKSLYQNSKEWQLGYWLHQKAYYENNVSNGTHTEGYKGVLEMLRILRTPKKDLSLLLVDIITEEAKTFLLKRFNESINL